MPNYRALPSTLELPQTLAQRLRFIREYRNLTIKDLARATRFSMKRVEDIEAGLETWLSATDRQLISKALSVEPAVLQEVERRARMTEDPGQIGEEQVREIGEDILRGVRDLTCPVCGSDLRCSVQEGFDLDGQPIQLPKAFCTKCPWILRY